MEAIGWVLYWHNGGVSSGYHDCNFSWVAFSRKYLPEIPTELHVAGRQAGGGGGGGAVEMVRNFTTRSFKWQGWGGVDWTYWNLKSYCWCQQKYFAPCACVGVWKIERRGWLSIRMWILFYRSAWIETMETAWGRLKKKGILFLIQCCFEFLYRNLFSRAEPWTSFLS